MRSRSLLIGRVLAALLTCVIAATVPATTASADSGPPTGVGPSGTALMHGDLFSTDSTGNPGPGRSAHLAASSVPGGACAATFVGSDGLPVSLCTNYIGTGGVAAPTVTLFDPGSAAVLARLPLTKGGLLGGVYGYLDDHDRVVIADGSGAILRVAHRRSRSGWQLYISERTAVRQYLSNDDAITGLAPDWQGRVWFATTHGTVGTLTYRGTRRIIGVTRLPAGEQLGNGLTIRPGGASILTTHALYEMKAGSDGVPRTVWRRAYDRGPARKPGQLTWGSGTTPTYFGPGGDGWVAIVDSAARRPNLLVYRSDDGALVCRMPAFGTSGQGTENSPMAWGNSLVIPSTYGYQYPPMAVTGPSLPGAAGFQGGSTRIDVTEHGCRRVWENGDRIATLPKLSRADGLIHAVGYGPYQPNSIQQLGPVYYIATDFATGARVTTRKVGDAPFDEPMELTGTIAPAGTLWQGTLGRMLKISR
ncbi:MAG: hypothetical protein QM662_11105 [Gordonia sp. (in: high G+C Gram-positive bacteria)]